MYLGRHCKPLPHPVTAPDGQLEDLALAQLLVGRVTRQQLPQLGEGAAHVLLPKSFSKTTFLNLTPAPPHVNAVDSR